MTKKEKFSKIPDELKTCNNWVCWKAIPDPKPDNPNHISKKPICALTGLGASSADPKTWCDYETAVAAAEKYSGIGFVFTDSPYFGVDLDGIGGELDSYVQGNGGGIVGEFVDALGSYAEISQSGKGIHIICGGKLPEGGRRRDKVEMYETGRYFIMTGNALTDSVITDCTEKIKQLHTKYITGESKPPIMENTVKSTPISYKGMTAGQEEAKQKIKESTIDILAQLTQPAKAKVNGKTSYVCPFCGHGKGGDGMTENPDSKDGHGLKCFGCGFSGDIIALIGQLHNKDFNAALEEAAGYIGITIDRTEYKPKSNKGGFTLDYSGTPSTTGTTTGTAAPAPQGDDLTENNQSDSNTHIRKVKYQEFLEACKAEVNQTDYYAQRGIEQETIEKLNLGYVTTAVYEKYKEVCKLPNIVNYAIIPYNENDNGNYWTARNTSIAPNIKGSYKWIKPEKGTVGEEPIFNEAEIHRETADPLFITEAALDCISIMQSGGAGIALCGLGTRRLLSIIDNMTKSGRGMYRAVAIAFDNDENGQEAAEKLKEELSNRNIDSVMFPYREGIKDCNAYLVTDKDGLSKAVKHLQWEIKDKQQDEYIKISASERLKVFKKREEDTPPTPTSFLHLDKMLDGGLYEGLYVIGAISSLGKTTFVMQIVDQIAHNHLSNGEKDIMVFSLEMAATELIAKSVSRESYLYCKEKKIDTRCAKTVRGLTDRRRYGMYDKTELEVIKAAEIRYTSYADHIFIEEGLGNIGVDHIREAVRKHRLIRGEAPVVVVDYLQILAPYNERAGDKQNTDKAVLELKRISRDYKTPVIAISSFNRDNYNTAVTMAAFKESGAIEYSSDVLIGLQPQNMQVAETDPQKAINRKAVDECKKKEDRDVEAVILKNRNGAVGKRIQYTYHTLFNCYEEMGADSQENKNTQQRGGAVNPI